MNKQELENFANRISTSFDGVNVEVDYPMVVTGKNETLQQVKAFLDKEGLICDNEAIGSMPEKIGMIMICYEGVNKENGYLAMPEDEEAQIQMGNDCFMAAIGMMTPSSENVALVQEELALEA